MAEKRNEYGFVRQILKEVPKEHRKKVFETFAEANLELYHAAEETEQFVPMLSAEECKTGSFCVSAADWEFAQRLAEQNGFSEWLCSSKEAVIAEDPVAEAEIEYYRKHRMRMLECAVVLVLGILYLLLHNIR